MYKTQEDKPSGSSLHKAQGSIIEQCVDFAGNGIEHVVDDITEDIFFAFAHAVECLLAYPQLVRNLIHGNRGVSVTPEHSLAGFNHPIA